MKTQGFQRQLAKWGMHPLRPAKNNKPWDAPCQGQRTKTSLFSWGVLTEKKYRKHPCFADRNACHTPKTVDFPVEFDAPALPPMQIVRDENEGVFRVSSAAFENSSDGTPTSIHLEEVARKIGLTAAQILASYVGYRMASLTAGQARACEQAVLRDPLPNDPTHGFIAGIKSKSLKRKLAAACTWESLAPGEPGAS